MTIAVVLTMIVIVTIMMTGLIMIGIAVNADLIRVGSIGGIVRTDLCFMDFLEFFASIFELSMIN